jgi:toxin FitB
MADEQDATSAAREVKVGKRRRCARSTSEVYLVDTSVISGAPAKSGVSVVVGWTEAHSADLYMSAVSIADIEDGIARLRRQGATRRARDLTAWLETLLHLYEDRVLPFDVRSARTAGALSDLARNRGPARVSRMWRSLPR